MADDPLVLTSVRSTAGVSQLSVTVKTTASGTESHSTVIATGSVSTNTGAVVSTTVTTCEWETLFPATSVAIQVLVNV